MTDRELVTVFWATCAAVCLIWAIATLVRLGVDQQERAERLEILDELTREAHEDLDAYRTLTAPRAADQPTHPTTHEAAVGERS